MNYIIDLPEDIYYEILPYLQEKELIIIFKVRRFKYKKLFFIKFPKFFSIINLVKNKDIRLKVYPYKFLFYKLFNIDLGEFNKVIESCKYEDMPFIHSHDIKDVGVEIKEILYAYLNIINFPKEVGYLTSHDFPMNHNYISGYLKNDDNLINNNKLIVEWMYKDYDYMYIDKKLNRDDYDNTILFNSLCMKYLLNINNVNKGVLIIKYKELVSLAKDSYTPEDKFEMLNCIRKILKLEHSIDI